MPLRTIHLESGGGGWDGEEPSVWRILGTTVVSKCYVPEGPPYVHKPPNNRVAYANCPKGAPTIQPGAERSGAAAERRPRLTGPHTLKAPTGAPQELTRCVLRTMFASCEIFIERMVFMEYEPASSFVTPRLGLGNYFDAFPGRRDAGVAAAIALPRARLYRPVGPEEWRLPVWPYGETGFQQPS